MLKHSRKSSPDPGLMNESWCLQTDMEGIVLALSAGLLAFTGKQEKDLVGHSFGQLIDQADLFKLKMLLQQAAAGQPVRPAQFTIIGNHQRRTTCFSVRQNNNPAALAWQEEKMFSVAPRSGPSVIPGYIEHFFHHSRDPFCIADGNGNLLTVNAAMATLTGYTMEELTGYPLLQLIHADDRAFTGKAWGLPGHITGCAQLENRLCCKDGTTRWLNWSVSASEPYGLLLANAHDVTGHKAVADNLAHKAAGLDMIVSSLDDIVFEFDTSFRYKKVWCGNERLLQILPNNFLGKTPAEVFGNAPEIAGPFMQDMEQALNNNEIHYRDFCLIHNEEVNWFNSKISPLYNSNGRHMGFSQRITDISEKKKVEDAVREKNAELRKAHHELNEIISNASEIIFRIDTDGHLLFVSPEFEKALGYTAEEVNGWRFNCLVHPDDVPLFQKALIAIRDDGQRVRNLHLRARRKNNVFRWFSASVVFSFDDYGYPLYGIGLAQDITELKEAMEVLQAAEEKNRYQASVLNHLFDAVMSSGPDFVVRSWNQAAEKLYGLTASGVIGHLLKEFITFRYYHTTQEAIEEELMTNGYWTGEAAFTRPADGQEVVVLSSISIIKDEQGIITDIITINKDITDKKLAQRTILESEERYRSVVQALGEGIVMYDRNSTIIAVNKSAEHILGIRGQEMLGQTPVSLYPLCVHEDGRLLPDEQHPALITLRTGQSFKQVIVGVQRLDHALVWLSVNTEPIYYTAQRIQPDAVVSSFVDISHLKASEQELVESQHQLTEYAERITNILGSINDGFVAIDNQHKIVLWNPVVERVTGIKAASVIGLPFEKVFPGFKGTEQYRQFAEAVNGKEPLVQESFVAAYGSWIETTLYPWLQGAFIYFRDVTERKEQKQLLELEKQVLEINARQDVPLKTTIDFLLEELERISPGMICSLFTLEEDGHTLHHLSAPSLPVAFSKAIEGLTAGPQNGSCGTATYRKEKVIVTDTFTDPLWDNYRQVAHEFGLRSCWSFPILNAADEVLATLATYYSFPKLPGEKVLNMLQRVCNLLRVVIENKNAEKKIRVSNERYLLVTRATNDAIWDWDVATGSLYWGEGFYALFGYRPGYANSSLGFWESCIHPEDRDRVVNGLNQFVHNNNSQIWEDEYRFKKSDGEYALVYDRGFLIFDHAGNIHRMAGSMQDITEKKELQNKLLKQELDKQKLVAQAVVNAQEKERAEIGKELHDNVNQILSTAKLYLELAKIEEDERVGLIDRSTDNISNAINEIRNISRSLVPSSVGDLGLVDSIRDLVENIKATKKLHVRFIHKGPVDKVTDQKYKLMLFRIIQEQVNNVLKHAEAQNIEILLILEDQEIELSIQDDGKGFEPEKMRTKKGVGLSNIASRAELFNGKVIIYTAPGQGCRLTIKVPI